MLYGLDEVDWRELSHAHGVAADVPDQLRAVGEGDAADAEQALLELYENLWNDGRAYPATAAAVPFLIELASSPAVESGRRVDLLVLLARIGAAAGGDAADRRRIGAALDEGAAALGAVLDQAPELGVAAAGLAAILPTPPRAWTGRLRGLRDAVTDPLLRTHFAVAAAVSEGRQPPLRDLEAVALDPYLAAWRRRRWEGLLGMRVSRREAIELSLTLTELALERV